MVNQDLEDDLRKVESPDIVEMERLLGPFGLRRIRARLLGLGTLASFGLITISVVRYVLYSARPEVISSQPSSDLGARLWSNYISWNFLEGVSIVLIAFVAIMLACSVVTFLIEARVVYSTWQNRSVGNEANLAEIEKYLY